MDSDPNHGSETRTSTTDCPNWWDKADNNQKLAKDSSQPAKDKVWKSRWNPVHSQKKFSKSTKFREKDKFECENFTDRPLNPQFENLIENLLESIGDFPNSSDCEQNDNSDRNEWSNDLSDNLDCPTSSTDVKVESIEKLNDSATSSKSPPAAIHPTISLVPLSFLIDPRLQSSDSPCETQTSAIQDDTTPDSSDGNESTRTDTAREASDVSNFKKPELISRKIINQVATMDKTNIRNVINNPNLKFDVALKMQAKKRLRQEIRKQLRNIHFENLHMQMPPTSVEPDSYIDPEHIPAEVMQQFESMFEVNYGINHDVANYQNSEQSEAVTDASSSVEGGDECMEETRSETGDSLLNDNRLEDALRYDSPNCGLPDAANSNHCQQQEPSHIDNNEVVCIDSPNDNEHTMDESSVDSSATTLTNASNETALSISDKGLRKQFLRSFKIDILPNLPDDLKRDYTAARGKDNEIDVIHNICLQRLRDLPIFLDILKKKMIETNNDEAIRFLLKNIRYVFAGANTNRTCAEPKQASRPSVNKNRSANACANKNKKIDKTPQKNAATQKKNCETSNVEREPRHRKEDDSSNPRNSSTFEQHDRGRRWNKFNDESRDRNHFRQNPYIRPYNRRFNDQRNWQNNQSNRFRWQNDRNRSPNRNRRDEEYRRMDGNRKFDAGRRFDQNRQGNQNNPERFGNKQNACNAVEPMETNTEPSAPAPSRENQKNNESQKPAPREPVILAPKQTKSPEANKDKPTVNVSPSSTNERLWRSPGEKKCVEPSDQPVLEPPRTPSPKLAAVVSLITPPHPSVNPTDPNISEEKDDHMKNDDVSATTSPSKISIETENPTPLKNLKDLDARLMQLNEKKMELEKKIIELQKEKMEIDLTVMQLQNDRFALISSAVSDSNGLLNANANLQNLLTGRPLVDMNTSSPTSSNGSTSPKKSPTSSASKKKKKGPETPVDLAKKLAFAEALKNRKKRCHRDILIEDAALTLFPDSSGKHEEIKNTNPSDLTAKVNDIFSMPRRSSQRPVQVVTPEKSKQKQNLIVEDKNSSSSSSPKIPNNSHADMLPLSCAGMSVNIIESDNSDDEVHDDGFTPMNGGVLSTTSCRNVRNGKLTGFRLPIVKMTAYEGHIICASEDGNIYKFDSSTRDLIATFAKHTESITGMFIDSLGCVYSTSLDGYMKKTTVENFGLELLSINLHEPLQAINICWNVAYVGSRWGNIFTYDLKKNKLNDNLLCSVNGAITSIRATREGPRRIIVISAKGESIHLRDASTGLLLRTMSVLDNHNISSLIFNSGLLYCGSTGDKVFVYDFTTGYAINTFTCGNGAISIKIFRNKILFVACYNGYVYCLHKETGKQLGRFQGAGKMLLTLEIIGEKIITSSKDNEVQIMDIPKCILNLTK